jgi:hypothetical protein
VISANQAELAELPLQRAVLSFLLQIFPRRLTFDELLLELASDPTSFAERDAISNAARDLVGTGLLHREGRFLFPTHACLRAHELLTF